MSKGEETRARVLAQAGGLMNRTGYLATPLSSILEEVGLQKGGLYNHFESKEALALEAFHTNTLALGSFLMPLVRGSDPEASLWALLEASLDVAAGRVVPGGCPVLNAGIESDDAHEPLRHAASNAYDNLRRMLLLPLRRLEREGRLSSGIDVEAFSWLLLAVLEGGILTAKVTASQNGQRAVLASLRQLLKGVVLP